MPTSRNYHSYLIESLKNPQEAAAYLDAVLEDCSYDELYLALKNVAEARLAISNNSQEFLSQDDFQKILPLQNNLDLTGVSRILVQLGFKLSVTPIKEAA